MKKIVINLTLLLFTTLSFAQNVPAGFFDLVKKADSLYTAKDYKNAALIFSKAFKSKNLPGNVSNERYKAACAWARANYPDSAFFQLRRIAALAHYKNYDYIITDADLRTLHADKRWNPLIGLIKQNKEKAEANLNKPLAAQLDTIYTEDQQYRQQVNEIQNKFGGNSKQMEVLWKIILENDSVNQMKIAAVIDKYGWPGKDVAGDQGNSAIFLVIQHANIPFQEKYLPIMREAVKNGKAASSDLALLEDRIAIGTGKKQIYGSQIGRDASTQLFYVLPIEDPDNVDKRRTEAGLPPIANYVSYWKISWNLEQYKKDLQAREVKAAQKKSEQ